MQSLPVNSAGSWHKSLCPSSGSSAISTLGPFLVPTSSPIYNIGASSRSPSPITTLPSMGSRLSSRAHRIHCNLISGFFIALPPKPGCCHSSTFCYAHQFEGENTIEFGFNYCQGRVPIFQSGSSAVHQKGNHPSLLRLVLRALQLPWFHGLSG